MSNASPVIGVLAQFLGGYYFGNMLNGICQEARAQGARVIAIQSLNPWGSDTGASDYTPFETSCAWNMADGWIVVAHSVTPGYLERLCRLGKPVLALGAQHDHVDISSIVVDNRQGVAEAVRHLIAHGHRAIGFVGWMAQSDIRERYEGYKAAMEEAALPVDPSWHVPATDNLLPNGKLAAERLLEAGMPCSAIVAGTDLNAIGIIEALQAVGYRVPEGVAVIGFDNISMAPYTHPPLTTLNQPLARMGEIATSVLLDQVRGGDGKRRTHYVETALVRRSSCGCTPAHIQSDDRDSAAHSAAWQQELVLKLRGLLEPSLHVADSNSAARMESLWHVPVDGLGAVLGFGAQPSYAELEEFWLEVGHVTLDLVVQDEILTLVETIGARELARLGDVAKGDRFQLFLRNLRLAWVRAAQHNEQHRSTVMVHMIESTYDLSMALFESHLHSPRDLTWMPETLASWGCLALWDHAPAPGGMLTIVGSFVKDGAPSIPRGMRLAVEDFPPRALLPPCHPVPENRMLALVPIKGQSRDWGLLALEIEIEVYHYTLRDRLRQWGAVLGAALDHEAGMLALQEQRRQAQEAYEHAQTLVSMVRELGSPVIPLLPNVLLMPLVGTMTGERAEQFIEAMLQGVTEHRASTVLIDITGLTNVDTQSANSLIQATRAATLLGARVTLVGVRPEIAQSIVALEISLPHMRIEPTLAQALERLMSETPPLAHDAPPRGPRR